MPRVITVGYQWPRAAIRAMRSPAPKKRYQSAPPATHARWRSDAASDPAPARKSVGLRYSLMCPCGLTPGVARRPAPLKEFENRRVGGRARAVVRAQRV